MPCFRCSTRQTDPVRGASPWHRVVVGGEQVLVCPTCRPSPEWETILDRCDRCSSTRLAKALGTVLCRDCGARQEPSEHPSEARPVGTDSSADSNAEVSTTATTGLPDGQAGSRAGSQVDSPVDHQTGSQSNRCGDLAADVDAALARMFGRARPIS